MQKIGDIEFVELSGDVARFGTVLEGHRRAGRSGHLYRDIGRAAETFTLRGKTTYTDLELAVNGLRLITSYKGTFKNIEYNGEVFSDVVVLDVQAGAPQKHALASDNSTYHVNSGWTLRLTRQE